ncbi:glycosyltransferase family 4 protein [soil metagenome]
MKITLVGTYSPRKCGIATFTKNLCDAIEINSDKLNTEEVRIVAVDDIENGYSYDDKIFFAIKQECRQDYTDAANAINNSGTDVCILQHEYGIFGGESGIYILTLLNHLKVPAIATVHTVLKKPSFLQKVIIQEIAKSVFKIAVMSKMAVEFLKTIYEIPAEKIILIEHGVPDTVGNSEIVKEELAVFGKKRFLFTFGLLSKNKGIETVIKALPDVIVNHPDVLYIVLGNTHPAVLRHSGEEYRDSLVNLAQRLNVDKNICFINRFVTDEELFTFLKNVDIYITPYLNEDQITSGTLSYAIGAGAASVSTPYWHAKELLDHERGKLFPFKNATALNELLNELLDDPFKLQAIQKNAYQYAQYLKWPRIGARYIKLAGEAIAEKYYRKPKSNLLFNEKNMPAFSLAHVRRLTDDTGIVQHAKYGIPNLKEGYCLDDNARALIMVLMSYEQYRNMEALELLPVYLSYIHYMQREDGCFRNFLHFNRDYLDEVGSEDSFGRTIWALCYLMYNAPNNSYREFAHELFNKSYPLFKELKHLRGIANTLVGISYYLKIYPSDEGMMDVLTELTDKLTSSLVQHSTNDWVWFEEKMTYDNGILPLALLHSYEITGNVKVKRAALQAIAFLKKKTLYKEHLVPVGNDGWCYKDNPVAAVFDQQAIEVMAMVLMFEQAYCITKNPQFLEDMNTSFMWFMGKNELHIPLYDHETHGCSDGLEYNSINRNQGAESTLAYLISYLAAIKINEKEEEEELHTSGYVPGNSKDIIKIKGLLQS